MCVCIWHVGVVVGAVSCTFILHTTFFSDEWCMYVCMCEYMEYKSSVQKEMIIFARHGIGEIVAVVVVAIQRRR